MGLRGLEELWVHGNGGQYPCNFISTESRSLYSAGHFDQVVKNDQVTRVLTCWSRLAAGKWIPCKVTKASANRGVINDAAQRVRAAGSWTRVNALLPGAGFVAGAIGINQALRATVRG